MLLFVNRDLSNNKLEGGLLDSVKTMTALQTL